MKMKVLLVLEGGLIGKIDKNQLVDEIRTHLGSLISDTNSDAESPIVEVSEFPIAESDPLTGTKLTPREIQMIFWLAKGYNIKQTSTEMGIAVETVRGYLQDVYTKLHISSLGQLGVEAVRLGIVTI